MALDGYALARPFNGYQVIIVGVLLILMQIIVTAGRFLSRKWQSIGFALDDFSLLLAIAHQTE